jgi:hypothetical protein
MTMKNKQGREAERAPQTRPPNAPLLPFEHGDKVPRAVPVRLRDVALHAVAAAAVGAVSVCWTEGGGRATDLHAEAAVDAAVAALVHHEEGLPLGEHAVQVCDDEVVGARLRVGKGCAGARGRGGAGGAGGRAGG